VTSAPRGSDMMQQSTRMVATWGVMWQSTSDERVAGGCDVVVEESSGGGGDDVAWLAATERLMAQT